MLAHLEKRFTSILPLVYSRAQLFSRRSQQLLKNLDEVSTRTKLKTPAANMKKLQSFLHDAKDKKDLTHSINRTMQYDQEFDDFLKKFRAKHDNIPKIIDLSRYASEEGASPLAKPPELREEELKLLEEFRKRRSEKGLKTGYVNHFTGDRVEDIAFKSLKRLQNSDQGFNPPHVKGEKLVSEHTEHKTPIKARRQQDVNLARLFKNEDFLTIILCRDHTVKVTTLQRINHFRYLIITGNGNGMVAYGKGRGLDYESALINAYKEAKKNLIAIPVDPIFTLTKEIHTRHMDFKLILWPRGTTNAWGHPIMNLMLQMVGIWHYKFKIISSHINNYSMVFAFMDAITQIKPPKHIAEIMGEKIYHTHYGNRKYSNTLMSMYNVTQRD
jgi:small subunit ribosomal protein S5